jgi:hypothetical protein
MTTRNEMPIDPFRAFMGDAGEGWRSTMFHQLERFWEAQGRIVDEYQSMSRAMLERRRAAVEQARDTMHRMSTASDGAEWAKCCTDWFSGSFTRLAEDGRDLVQGGLKLMSEMSQGVASGAAEAMRAAGEAQRESAREATAAAGAAADQGAAMAQEAARAARAQQKPRRPDEMRPGAAE